MADPLAQFYFKAVVGMDNRTDELDLSGKKVKLAQNCRFGDEPGAVIKRQPLAYYNSSEAGTSGGMLGLYRYYYAGGAKLISVRDDKVYVGSDTAGTLTQIRDLANSGRRMSFVTYNDLLIGSNGYDNLWVYDGSTDNVTWELGSCKIKASTGAGAITKTGVSYQITYDNGAYICGAISNEIDVTSKSIELSNIPLGPSGSDHRKIFRKDSGTSGAYKFVYEMTDDAATSYTDDDNDVSGEATIGSVTDDMPKGNILQIHKERLFISGNPTYKNRVWYANPFLPHYIQQDTNLDYFDIAKDDGDQIQGLPIHMGTMICIKQNTMRKVFVAASSANVDPATWYADDPMAYVGTPAQWSICQTPFGIVFLGWDGWYVFDGSAPKPFIQEFNTDKILPGLYNDVITYYNDGKLYASYADRETAPTISNRVMVYNTVVGEYALDTMEVSCFASASGADEAGEMYLGSADSGFVYKAEEGDIWHRASALSDIDRGTAYGLFTGGPEGNPVVQIGADASPSAIPSDMCIFWEDETTTPGSGWTEVISNGKFVLISTTSGTSAAASPHTHTISGTLLTDAAAQADGGDGGPQGYAFSHHTHTVSITSSSVSAYPTYVQLRVFKKNATTTEYEFPVGSILMWDQASSPDGWVGLSYLSGAYVRMAQTDLGAVVYDAGHSHTYSGDSSNSTYAADAELTTNTKHTLPTHHHLVHGTTLSAGVSSWELDRLECMFIKKISDTAPWDGTSKYVYALYYGAGTPGNGWEEKSSTYDAKFLKIADALTTGVRANYSHTHELLGGSSDLDDGLGEIGGYHSQPMLVHSHELSITASSTDLASPESLTFRLFRKLLGQMVTRNDAITVKYTNGLYVSPPLELSAQSYGTFYFNATIEGTDTISAFFRTGATEASVDTGLTLTVDHTADKFTCVSHGYSNGDRVSIEATGLPTGILNTILYHVVNVSGSDFKVSLTAGGDPVAFSSNGTAVTSKKWTNPLTTSNQPMLATVNVWIQYLFEFVAADTTDSIPTLFYADGYVVKFNYRKSGTIAETAVEFIYETGEMNHDEPMVDKIYKRFASEHMATAGSLQIVWTTENSTSSWTLDLSRYTRRWQSFFHDTAMGEQVSIKYYKNDLEDFTLKEFKGVYTPQPMQI